MTWKKTNVEFDQAKCDLKLSVAPDSPGSRLQPHIRGSGAIGRRGPTLAVH